VADGTGFTMSDAPTAEPWGDPDMSVLRLNRRPPPTLSMEVFGAEWGRWITETAEAAGCPPDYVAAPLLALVSALIGHARWAQATPGWAEPPHLWICSVGYSGTGKSPGADCLMGNVLPELERLMLGDFPDRHRDWQAAAERAESAREAWQKEVRTAQKQNAAAPLPPEPAPPEPQAPRLRQNDVTIEKVATLLATAAPKGLLIVRDEFAGWLAAMTAYNDAGRAFWIEAYGGRPYRVERQKNPEPIDVPRLAVAVYGGTQPEKLASLFADADDGLFSRVAWLWPEPLPFRLSRQSPQVQWAVEALDRLRLLELAPDSTGTAVIRPLMVPMTETALPLMEQFGREMQQRQTMAGGLMRSAYGKARGLALRLSLVIEMLWWCRATGTTAPPTQITESAFLAAAASVSDYFMPSAERVYGDAGTSRDDRNAATLARWIVQARPAEVHVRRMLREVRLPGLATAAPLHAAAAVLIEADWLRKPHAPTGKRPRLAYPVNPKLLEAAHELVG
jgi:Protein of unknown function (DUF3987)